MKKLIIFTVIGIAIFSLAITGRCREASQVFQFTITSDKKIYKPEDNMEFLLILKNITPEDRYIYIEDIYNADLFTITDEAGNNQPSERTIMYDIMWDEKDYKLVKAGEEYKRNIKAKIRKEKNSVIDFDDSLIKLAHSGKFKVFVTYDGWDGITVDTDGKEIAISKKIGLKNVFVDSLISNTILIEIK
ncbi:MAG: hypothetical protein V1739_02025 [Candidatus Omnitrophota bacterium]